MKKCYKCGAMLNDDDLYCVFCGANLSEENIEKSEALNDIHFCKTCNLEIKDDEKFCSNCGAPNPYFRDKFSEKVDFYQEENNYQYVNERKEMFRGKIFKTIPEFYKNYFNFKGRACKAEFFFPWIVVDIVVSTISTLVTKAFPALTYSLKILDTELYQFNIISLILSLALYTIPTISCMVRRIRDTGRSGWNFLLYMIPIAGPIIIFFMCLQDSKEEREKNR